MTRAVDIPGLHAATPFSAAAREIVAVRAAELFGHLEGVLDVSEIERVHAARVATRRLRAVLEICGPCFDRAQLRPVLRDVKALADALGARRDPDVHLVALRAFAAAAAPEDGPGIELLAGRFRAEQEAGNETLAAALRAVDASDLRGRIAALVGEAA